MAARRRFFDEAFMGYDACIAVDTPDRATGAHDQAAATGQDAGLWHG